MEKTKLNLGCGIKKLDDHINIDMLASVDPDIIHNLEDYPWPLPENQFEEVRASHIVEHIGTMGDADSWFNLWREIWRVCKPGAIVYCLAPYYTDHNSAGDPGHRRLISESSFYFLSKEVYKSNAMAKSPMTQYNIDFDFEIRAQKVMNGDIQTWLKCIKEKKNVL